jgi:hypothetical protein
MASNHTLEHEWAYYLSSGLWVPVRADKVERNPTLKNAVETCSKNQDLIERTTGRRLKFMPKTNVRRAHFSYVGEARRPRALWDGREDKDPTHDNRLYWLLFHLRRFKKITFKCGSAVLAVADEYHWTKETQRILSGGGIVRHDIFGSRHTNVMSINEPTVAIEVVATHFPEQASLDDMVHWTRLTPSIVCFDLAGTGGKLSGPNLPKGPDGFWLPPSKPPRDWKASVRNDYEMPKGGNLEFQVRSYIADGRLMHRGEEVLEVRDDDDATRLNANALEVFLTAKKIEK